jgi:hypothetical protein
VVDALSAARNLYVIDMGPLGGLSSLEFAGGAYYNHYIG